MLNHSSGILLNSIKYSDTSSIAHIYTEQFGRISVLVRHPKSKKSVSKKSILQPLFLLDLEISQKQNRELKFAKEISNSPAFSDIPFNMVKSSIVFFVAEILLKVLREEEKNPEMFHFLHNSIQLLDHLESGTQNFHLVFLYELTKYLGFYPSANYSEQNKYFNLREGIYTDYQDIPEISLDENLSIKLHSISKNGFSRLENIDISRKQRFLLIEAILRYYRYHLPEMGQIKSLEILTQIFDV